MSKEEKVRSFEEAFEGKEVGTYMQGRARGELFCPESPEKAEELGQSDMAMLIKRFS